MAIHVGRREFIAALGGAGGEGSGDHPGHLTGCQGVLTPPSIAFSPLPAAARRTPRIQNNSGLPQGPATGSVVG